MNWTKTLLKDSFNKPIFIYTDDKLLSKIDLAYETSRGIDVIDYHNLTCETKKNDFLKRYSSVLDEINKSSLYSFEAKSEVDIFHSLYQLLEPLNKLSALRFCDIKEKLNDIIIDETGVIRILYENSNWFSYFVKIHESDKKDCFDESILKEYGVILSVLQKAQIEYILYDNHYIKLINKFNSFADLYCLELDYKCMNDFVSQNYKDYISNYKKAFYLSKLFRYKEAYDLFCIVATDSYLNEDYLVHYFAQYNRCILFQAMRSINHNFTTYNLFDIDALKDGEYLASQKEDIFERLPLEFQNQYNGLKNIITFNILFENSYYSFKEGLKLNEKCESDSIEMGVTSADKVISRIRENLNFFLGNGLYIENFEEFSTTLRFLMSTLVQKYAMQFKTRLNKDELYECSDRIILDNIDFYCLIEYFDVSDLNKLMNKYSIDTLSFEKNELIENSVINLLSYYEDVVNTKQTFEILQMENKILRCLNLLRFIDISQKLVDFVCKFIFKYEFREICIDDKIRFLSSQLRKRNMYSNVTHSVIENKLIDYLDKHLDSYVNHIKFHMYSRSGLNYPKLIGYISADDTYTSRKLANRINKIIDYSYEIFEYDIENTYYPYLSKCQKTKVNRWIKNNLANKFSFENLKFLAFYGIDIDNKTIYELKNYLRNEIKSSNNLPNGMRVYPEKDHLKHLEDIGYYCFMGYLKKDDFIEFLNCSPEFDFFMLENQFDFNQFNIRWLLYWNPYVFESISKDKGLKIKVRDCLKNALNNDQFKDREQKKLTDILIKYFC